jgi:hypothetical protein
LIIKTNDKIKNILLLGNWSNHSYSSCRETLNGTENLNRPYESDEQPNGLNYANKGNEQGAGIETLEGTNWLDDKVG